MKPRAKLLHKTCTTYLPSASPAHFYGMPDGNIYLIFSRFYNVAFDRSGLEFIFARHTEFSYDYENDKIFSRDRAKKMLPVFAETIDKPNPKIKIVETIRDLKSFGEALSYLNTKSEHKLKTA
ncbi:hypothetical protein [Maribellus mangrovi]|uniref:hypothetical protein n=1 Tax=Maribellus mangrovi TaxID=3133146 RepID=UPI0030EF3728